MSTIAVPFLDLKAQYALIRGEVRSAIDRVLESQRFILGQEVEQLETEVAAYSRCRFAIGVSSGTDALLAALMAIELKPGEEVITTPYSFLATAAAVARLGARPVFVDIDPATFNIDTRRIESHITARTRAIIPVHLFGQMAEMDAISELARKHNLQVIEDAAQAISAELHGKRAGSVGDMGCFSFYPTKNLGGFGDGGMVTTNSEALAARLKLLRSHGSRSKYFSEILGGNFRLDEIQAAVLRVKLKYLDAWTEARQANARMYREQLAAVSRIELPYEIPGARHIYNQFVIQTDVRDALIRHLEKHRIGYDIYYPVPFHLQDCFRYLDYRPGDFPVSESASRRSLALPIYPELTPSMIGAVADVIRSLKPNG
jgi:dTDP-4-amino-4,6-dideoxygalactose transaminase